MRFVGACRYRVRSGADQPGDHPILRSVERSSLTHMLGWYICSVSLVSASCCVLRYSSGFERSVLEIWGGGWEHTITEQLVERVQGFWMRVCLWTCELSVSGLRFVFRGLQYETRTGAECCDKQSTYRLTPAWWPRSVISKSWYRLNNG